MDLSLSPAARHKLTNLLICFSVGNLCFLRRWYDLEHLAERSMDYYRIAPASPALLISTLSATTLLSLAFYAAWRWVEHRPTRLKLKIAHCGFLLVLMLPLESVRQYWNTEGASYDPVTNMVILLIETILLAGVVLAATGNARMVRAARKIALLGTLLFPSLVLDFTWAKINAEPASAFRDKPAAPRIAHDSKPRRVIWVLFDEMDQRLVFDLRQPRVDLPELDRLRAESFTASQAQQTAGWTTLAVPSLLSGEIFESAELIDASTLFVHPRGSKNPSSWRDQPNVFRRARAMGLNAALIGWHHPYCRVMGDDLVDCVEIPSGTPTAALLRETSAGEIGALRSIPFLFYLQWSNLHDVFRGQETGAVGERDEYVQHRQQRQYFHIRDLVYSAAVDKNIDLLFAHFPLPHLFGIYDRKRGDFTLSRSLSYADNLALADRTVGELRRSLEQAGLWDSTALVITSDHGLRPDLWRGRMGWTAELDRLTGGKQTPRVPLIVKLPGVHGALAYDRPFSSVVESDLILAILRNEISTPADVAAWIEKSAAFSESARAARPGE